jgi:hypothetical protein
MNPHRILFYLFVPFLLMSVWSFAQTAKVYRDGSVIGTYSKLIDASLAANTIGDSIVLSPHTFREHDIPIYGGQIWKGTMTATDSSIVDGEALGSVFTEAVFSPIRRIIFCDLIVQNGLSNRGSGITFKDSLILAGRTTIRSCRALSAGGAVEIAYLYGSSKLSFNVSDSFGGAGTWVFAYDSSEICYNKAQYGGAIGDRGRVGKLISASPQVKIHHNFASVEGGALYVTPTSELTSIQLYSNTAPRAAGLSKAEMLINVKGCRIFNPKSDGTRQTELYLYGGPVDITGTWLGQSDTVGLILRNIPGITEAYGKHAICKWIVNRGKPVTKADTLFPVDAVFTYVDGTPLPSGSLPWLQGVFTANKGSFVNPNPIIMPSDTLRGMYRAYTHLPGDTGSRSVSFVCSVDADTFRKTIPVWGKLTTSEVFEETEVKIYPNPTSDIVYISGLQRGLELQLEDISGKQLLRRKVQTETEQINLQSYPVGSYMIHILDGAERISSQQMFKQ